MMQLFTTVGEAMDDIKDMIRDYDEKPHSDFERIDPETLKNILRDIAVLKRINGLDKKEEYLRESRDYDEEMNKLKEELRICEKYSGSYMAITEVKDKIKRVNDRMRRILSSYN